MTPTEQIEFINDLTGAIRKELKDKIRAGRVPDDWDGHELRMWLAVKFNESAVMSQCHPTQKCRERRKLFVNTCIIHNL